MLSYHSECCQCGLPIQSNPSNMCVNCLQSQHNITQHIPRSVILQWCKKCGRYFQPPSAWIYAELESRELLTICLKRLRGINKMRLIDASFIWTEPHSRRLKVKLTVQAEVQSGTVLEQSLIVEYVVQSYQCDQCTRLDSNLTWDTVVQVRQKVQHKRTFLYLEQQILKHEAHKNCSSIQEMPDGLDFFFPSQNVAARFVQFISSIAAIRTKRSDKLVSADEKSHTATMKHSVSVELCPVCKEDLVVLSKGCARAHGNISRIALVTRAGSSIHVVDPFTGQQAELQGQDLWRNMPHVLLSAASMQEFHILDADVSYGGAGGGGGAIINNMSKKTVMADVEVVRDADFGRNDCMFYLRTHLGALLQPGDTARGYDLRSVVLSDKDATSLGNLANGGAIPDIVLVRKSYPRRPANVKRKWMLQHMTKEELVDVSNPGQHDFAKQRDYELFLRDLEEDEEYRKQVNVYKDPNAVDSMAEGDHNEADEYPEIPVEELLDNLNLNAPADVV